MVVIFTEIFKLIIIMMIQTNTTNTSSTNYTFE